MRFIGLIFVIASFFMAKYREQVGDSLGEPEWAAKVGGIYNLVIILAGLMFFWGLAMLTNTTAFLFGPIMRFIPFGG